MLYVINVLSSFDATSSAAKLPTLRSQPVKILYSLLVGRHVATRGLGGQLSPPKSRLAPSLWACSWVQVHRCVRVNIRSFEVKNMHKHALECIIFIWNIKKNSTEGHSKSPSQNLPRESPRARSPHISKCGYACGCVHQVCPPWNLADPRHCRACSLAICPVRC